MSKNTLIALKGDTVRQYGVYSLAALIKGFIGRRTFRPIVTLRLCQWMAGSRLVLPVFRILHRLSTNAGGMDLAWNTRVGVGLAITHGWGLVVSPGASIGNNVTLFHGVTLGRRDRISQAGERLTEYPIIEDEVWIGPHAIIVGGVTIGRGSRIAAGAFVTESIPPFSVVSGNPAVITKVGAVPDVMNRVPL